MLRRLSATPCPGSSHELQQSNHRNLSLGGIDETTANLDFTTELKASFRDVKPRRPPVSKPKVSVAFTIHEDQELGATSCQKHNEVASTMRMPRRRPRTSVTGSQIPHQQYPSDPDPEDSYRQRRPLSGLSKAPRRSSLRPDTSFALDESFAQQPKITKPARRGTIFIPEDTTMPLMFMDIFSPLKRHDFGSKNGIAAEPELTGLALSMAQKRGRRTSTIKTSPKRIPLARTQPQLDMSNTVHDRPGRGPGKENLRPDQIKVNDCEKQATQSVKGKALQPRESEIAPQTEPGVQASRLFEPTASSRGRSHPVKPTQVTKPKSKWNSNFLLPKPKLNHASKDVEGDNVATPVKNQTLQAGRPPVPLRFVVPSITSTVEDLYEILPEGIPDASMYEENWLGQQEIAITQLINNLFEAASPQSYHGVAADLNRLQLLEAYGKEEMSILHKRIQTCLAHGPLCPSSDGADHAQQLSSDLAKRKAYTDFWLTTYEPQVLHFGLEVIVGRVVPLRTSSRASSDFAADHSRAMRRFIEKFMIRNEDSASKRRSRDDESKLYQRTILRSMMLIKLLDMMKTDNGIKIPGRLFHKKSRIKTSTDAFITVFRMLNPNAAHPIRPLRNVGYCLSHEQYPLEEFEYHVENLAVDVRDGVRLTRLVELLLYRNVSGDLKYCRDSDTTANTITLASGATVSLTEGEQDWPLSQHLKMPCDSRAVRLYNVNLVLAALKGARGMNVHMQDLTASDVVDGHREKTVRLLWVLCSKYGLPGLVDRDDIKTEIKRLGRVQGKLGGSFLADFDELEDDVDGFIQCKALLKVWVKAIAMSRGTRVRNFTTDFGDGRLFGVIVSEYQPYLPGCADRTPNPDLDGQLKQLGCSNEFAKLFANKPGMAGNQQILDRDFVLASLAFLASRLLRPTKASRAAVVLQRAWRRRSDKLLIQRKKLLKSLAVACADHVHRVQAKARIWQAWSQFRAKRSHQTVTSPGGVDDIWLSL